MIGEMRKRMKNKEVKHPCQGCVYFNACGNTNRTAPCDGRMTKREKKNNAGVKV